jgi:hypothetical protein
MKWIKDELTYTVRGGIRICGKSILYHLRPGQKPKLILHTPYGDEVYMELNIPFGC